MIASFLIPLTRNLYNLFNQVQFSVVESLSQHLKKFKVGFAS